MAKVILREYAIKTAFVLSIVNKEFKVPRLRNRLGADADKRKIKKFCLKHGFTECTLKSDNLKMKEMEDLFTAVSRQDFSSYDAFICFISSHGDSGGIYGADGETITVADIVDKFKPQDEFRSLVGKPKLFFTQNCRGTNFDHGIKSEEVEEVEVDRPLSPIYTPVEADILVAYSSADGYESYRSVKNGSWFMSSLTNVFLHSRGMDLTDMLTIVNREVAKKDALGMKQMPCFHSSLRHAVYFGTSESSVLPPSSRDPPAL